ncbi:MAG TPA: LuxR C-terminal-related transcriptional regulator [Candidatus Cybelea sp.]|jgi:DNA-binding CsgD family transcriptional regulator|nr:LuxR C-terminal-related transcriptional regulator [Candidatus Cybelea sp.]
MQRRAARHRAYLKRVTGIVELALGNRARGLADLREARGIFERLGFDFRVGECLVAEYRATRDRDLLPLIGERLRNYQHSWLAKELSQEAEAPKPPLSPMQQAVFEQLCKGKSTAEIAAALERSEYTVSNHIKEIFKVFEVKSRGALLAKAAGQGLLGSP